MCLHKKVEEVNTLSDGKGIIGKHKRGFLMRWKIKRRRNANLCKLSQLHVFVFLKCKFEKFLMTVKAMCLKYK